MADVGGVAVGFMLTEFHINSSAESDDRDRPSVEIDWLDVHPQFQRLGVGTALMNKAEERARAKRCRSITVHTAVDNQAMTILAEICGFARRGVLSDFWGEGRGDAILLVKTLDVAIPMS